MSGRLDWTLLHKEETFWRTHCGQLAAKNCAVLRALVALLESPDARTVEVACHDIGQFIRFYPSGRNLCRKVDAKTAVMRLMVHPNPDVQKQALMW